MRLFANRKSPPPLPPAPPAPPSGESSSSFDRLLDERHRLDAEIRQRQGAELETLKRRITALAAVLGISVAELLGLTAPAERTEKKPRQPKPKYRHPTEPLTWSGRGKPPPWMQDLLDGGADKSDFLVDNT